MSSATLEARPILSLFNAIACGLYLAQLTFASEESPTTEVSDGAFLRSVQSSEITVQPKPPIGAFFASIIKSQEQIEFLAGHKRYEDLLKEVEGFRNTLDQASTVLPEHERQRAARFIAASRSLGQLSKAVHSFMWNGQDEQLYNATDKLKQLLTHVETLISPEELALAQAFRESAKG
jgi:hypothetical protein